jgi:hypothetical protein
MNDPLANNRQTLIFSVIHIAHLLFFYRLVLESNVKNEFNIKVIFQEQNSFNGKRIVVNEILRKISRDVIYIHSNEIVFYGRNIFKHAYNALRIKRRIKNNCDKNSILLASGDGAFGVYILMNYFARSILFTLPLKKIAMEDYKYSIKKTFMANILNLVLCNKLIKIYNYNQAEVAIKTHLSKIFSYPIYVGGSKSDGRMHLNFSSNVAQNKSNKVVIFGSAYNTWNINKSTHEKINKLHEAIYLKLKNKYEFYYLKHPIEDGSEFNEINSIFNKEIKLESHYASSEHYLLENQDTALCFSIGSNGSISAYEMGFNSKVFYRLLLLNNSTIKMYDSIFNNFPKEAHIDENILNIEDDFVIHKKDGDFTDLFTTIENLQ